MIPAQPIFFNLSPLSQIKKKTSFSTFSVITSAVAWAHKKFELHSPTESAMTKQLIRAGQRILDCAKTKGNHPLETDHLKALQDKFAYASLDQIQVVTLATLGFAGFLRWDDLSQIEACDINFLSWLHEKFSRKQKNDQFREASWIYIAVTRFLFVRKNFSHQGRFLTEEAKAFLLKSSGIVQKTIEKAISGSQFVWFAQFMFKMGQHHSFYWDTGSPDYEKWG